MRTKRIVAATFVVWLLGGYAQQAPQLAPRTPVVQQPNSPLQKPAYTFTGESQLVVLNVSAKDKSGKPVENLKAGDFTVTEDGKPQLVKIFEYQRLEEETLPALPAPPKPDKNAPPPPKPVAPAVMTTITPARPGEIKYKDKRLLVLYFDFQGMQPDDQIRSEEHTSE